MGRQLGRECLRVVTVKGYLIVEDYLRGSAVDLVSPYRFTKHHRHLACNCITLYCTVRLGRAGQAGQRRNRHPGIVNTGR